MAYQIYIDNFLLPVTPEKIVTKITNKNQSISLINNQELNILKNRGLTEIEFDFIIPKEQYPFAVYENGYLEPQYFLNRLHEIKSNKKSVRFSVLRQKSKTEKMFNQNMRVSIEDYQIVEDAENGFDTVVSIKLKQFDARKTKTGTIGPDNTIIVKEERPFFEDEKKTYILKQGDNLFDVCHMILGDGDLCTEVALRNGLKSPLDAIWGMLIRFDLPKN